MARGSPRAARCAPGMGSAVGQSLLRARRGSQLCSHHPELTPSLAQLAGRQHSSGGCGKGSFCPPHPVLQTPKLG